MSAAARSPFRIDEAQAGLGLQSASRIDRKRPARRRAAFRGFAAYAGFLALLVQALLPLADALYHARAGGLELAALSGDHGTGGAKSPTSDHHGGSAGGHDCSLCKGIQLLGTGLLPLIAVALAAIALGSAAARVWSDRLVAGIACRPPPSRAPPILT
jgi:hypothetical protein